ncbi:MAG: D-glycero-alpha-D-manno-heptose-1,7-bisphosphate 7-phosphatase [Gemmatimonadaceae bacterium]
MRAIFLDRDGVLNALVQRGGRMVSPRTVAEFRMQPEAASAVSKLRAKGYGIFVVTNQPDVARGYLSRVELESMHGVLAAIGLDEIVVCPHDDGDACRCRKPRPGMLLDIAERWSVTLADSVVVGDSWRDIEAGRMVGCRTVLVRSGAPDPHGPVVIPDVTVPDLDAAVAWILGHSK